MSLPLPWVDKIFDKLTLTYGQAFLARWRDIDLNAVKSDWMHELSSFANSPGRIAFALSNLPDHAPTVVEFKALCRQAPAPETLALPEPKADPARVRAELAKLAPAAEAMRAAPRPDDRAWARNIIAQHNAGFKKTPTVLQMARNAVGGE